MKPHEYQGSRVYVSPQVNLASITDSMDDSLDSMLLHPIFHPLVLVQTLISTSAEHSAPVLLKPHLSARYFPHVPIIGTANCFCKEPGSYLTGRVSTANSACTLCIPLSKS